MAVFLFDKIIFGPVTSRRLGVSLGINLLPIDSKLCNFNCIYCECGWTPKHKHKSKFHSRKLVSSKLEAKLKEMYENKEALDVITYAGNGEPTMHKEFAGVIDDTISLRNKYFPKVRIAVLSNATLIHKPSVIEALRKIDDNILKIDSAFDETIQILNQPIGVYKLKNIIESLNGFDNNLIIQTMFLRGNYNGNYIDNTTKKEIDAWFEIVKKINPPMLMIYTIARDTPTDGLEKITYKELKQIASRVEKLNIKVQISV